MSPSDASGPFGERRSGRERSRSGFGAVNTRQGGNPGASYRDSRLDGNFDSSIVGCSRLRRSRHRQS